MNTITVTLNNDVDIPVDDIIENIDPNDVVRHFGNEVLLEEMDSYEVLEELPREDVEEFIKDNPDYVKTNVESDPMRLIDEMFDEHIKDSVEVRNYLKERFLKEFKEDIVRDIVTKIMTV